MAGIHGQKDSPTLDLNFAKNKSLIDTMTGRNLVTFSRTQTGNEATYVGADGLIKYASADEPRFDHDPETGESLGLLIEEARTNYQPYGSKYDTSYWAFSYGIKQTPYATVSPDGTLSATLIQQDTTDSIHQLAGGFGFNSGYITLSSTYTLSLYVKYYNSNKIRFMEQMTYGSSTGGSYTKAGVVFNFATESIEKTIQWGDSGESRIAGYSVNKLPNGWYRLNLSVIPGTDTNNQRVYFGIYPQEGNLSAPVSIPSGAVGIMGQNYSSGTQVTNFVGDGSTGVYIWGAQVESGSFPTSYIPTTNATKTRSADVASITGSNFSSFYNQSEGSWYISYNKKLSPVNISNVGVLGPQHFYYRGNSTESVRRFGSNIVTTGMAANNNRIATGYDSTDFDISANGNIANNNIVATPTSQTTLNVMSDGLSALSSTVSRLTYWPERLSNKALQRLTR
jgi:hypothetical protein